MTMRWHSRESRNVSAPDVDAFLEEVLEVCRKHRMSIGHEDGHGAFVVEDFNESDADWLRSAHDNRTPKSQVPA